MMPHVRRRLAPLAALTALLWAAAVTQAADVRLRGDFPPGAAEDPIPVSGGVPLPRGVLKSAENVRLLAADGKEVPCHVAATAWWPDKSLKWVLVDAVLSPRAAQALTLQYGPDGAAAPAASDTSRQAVRVDLETGLLEVQFHDAAAPPAPQAAVLSGEADLIFHDGWRPPLAKPELAADEYAKFLDDLDYGGQYGLMALRFCLSTTHQVEGRAWAEKVRDLGIEPREVLYGMLWNDGLAKHCERIGVKWDAKDLEASVRRVIEHYRK